MSTTKERRRGGFRVKFLGIQDETNTTDAATPKMTCSSGAASAADPDGSLHLRTDGSPEYRIGSAWGAVAVSGGLFDLNGLDDGLVLDADGDTTISAPTDNQIDIEIAGADDFQFTANTFSALSGSTIKTDTIAETTGAAGVTIDSTLLKDGEVVLVDDKGVVFGTGTDFEATWTNASERMDMLGANKTDASSGALTIATGTATSATGAKTTGAINLKSGISSANGNNGGASGAIVIASGSTTTLTAHTGGVSGNVSLGTGDTNGSFAGSTGGQTGDLTLATGAASSTAGTSAATGAAYLQTGNSEDNNSGNVTVRSGTSAAGTTGTIAISSGNCSGAGTSGSITFTPGTTVAGTTGTIQAIGRLTTTDGVAAGTARVVGGLAYRSVARSDVSTNTDTETVFGTTGTYTIPANTLKAGSVIRVKAHGIVIDQNGGDTLIIRVRLGGAAGTALLTSATVDVADNDIFVLDGACQVRTAGAGGTQIAFGTSVLGVAGTATVTPQSIAETAVNTTGALDLVVTWKWSAGHDDNDVYLDCFEVWID